MPLWVYLGEQSSIPPFTPPLCTPPQFNGPHNQKACAICSSLYPSTNPTGCHFGPTLMSLRGPWRQGLCLIYFWTLCPGQDYPRGTWPSLIFPPAPLTILPLPVWTTSTGSLVLWSGLTSMGSWQGIRGRKESTFRVLILPSCLSANLPRSGCVSQRRDPASDHRLSLHDSFHPPPVSGTSSCPFPLDLGKGTLLLAPGNGLPLTISLHLVHTAVNSPFINPTLI